MNFRSFTKPQQAAVLGGSLGLILALIVPSAMASQDLGTVKNTSKDEYTPMELVGAGKVFQESCTFCHVVPDPAHPTDRAWLNQVSDTA
ncbi:MAG: hypothetical protein ACI8QC_002732 [Planctomycetota bacterium]|jgi:hypothetical protein